MKFTEGYWLPSEKANASHAMQAYEVEQIPGYHPPVRAQRYDPEPADHHR